LFFKKKKKKKIERKKKERKKKEEASDDLVLWKCLVLEELIVGASSSLPAITWQRTHRRGH
jgi:hypothetical protein